MSALPKPFNYAAVTVFFVAGILPVICLLAGLLTNIDRLSDISTGPHGALLLNSLRLASATAVFSLFAGVPIAFLVSKTDLPRKGLFKLAFAAILIIPPYISALAWIDMLGPDGFLRSFLLGIFGISPSIYGLWGSVFVLSMSSLPFVIFLSLSAFNSISSSLEDAAQYSPWFFLWRPRGYFSGGC